MLSRLSKLSNYRLMAYCVLFLSIIVTALAFLSISYTSLHYLSSIIIIPVFWLFISKELGYKKPAFYAFLAQIGLSFLYFYFKDSTFMKQEILLILNVTPFIIYSFLTLKTIKQKLKFLVLSIIILNVRLDYNIVVHWLSNSYYIQNMDNYIYLSLNFLNSFIKFVLFCEVFRMVKNNNSWKHLNITEKISQSKLRMTVYYFVIYLGILFMSIDLLITFLKVFAFSKFTLTIKIYFVIKSTLGLILLCWFFRKKLTEFYLAYHKKISWHYWSILIPFIGIIIWLTSIESFKKPDNIDIDKLQKLHVVDSTGIKYLIGGMIVLFHILPAVISLNISIILYSILSFALVLIYFYHSKGIIILLFSNIIYLAFITLADKYNFFEIESGMIEKHFFSPLAFAILYYPLYFLHTFKIEIEQNSNDINNKENIIIEPLDFD